MYVFNRPHRLACIRSVVKIFDQQTLLQIWGQGSLLGSCCGHKSSM